MRARDRALLLAVLLGVGGCAGLGTGNLCTSRDVTLRNASALPVEQVFLGTGAPNGWGADLLTGRPTLAPGGSMTLPSVGGPAARAVRVVLANGRATELGGLEGCRFGQVVVLEGAIRAE